MRWGCGHLEGEGKATSFPGLLIFPLPISKGKAPGTRLGEGMGMKEIEQCNQLIDHMC